MEKRIGDLKKIIRSHLKDIKPNEQIAVIGHPQYMSLMLNTWIEPCQVHEFTPDELKDIPKKVEPKLEKTDEVDSSKEEKEKKELRSKKNSKLNN